HSVLHLSVGHLGFQNCSSDTGFSNLDWYNQSIFVKMKFVNAGYSVVAVGFAQWPAMINDKPFICFGDMADGMMAGSGSNQLILLQYLSDAGKRAKGRICNCISNRVIGPRPIPFGPHEIIFAIF